MSYGCLISNASLFIIEMSWLEDTVVYSFYVQSQKLLNHVIMTRLDSNSGLKLS